MKGFSTSNFFRLNVIFSAVALLMGAFIYIIWRPVEPIFFQWAEKIGFYNWLTILRNNNFLSGIAVPSWYIYSLPNSFWAFAYTLLILQIWINSKSWLRYLWFASIPVLVTGIELLQYFQKITGTFCIEDVAFGILGIAVGIFMAFRTNKPINYENE